MQARNCYNKLLFLFIYFLFFNLTFIKNLVSIIHKEFRTSLNHTHTIIIINIDDLKSKKNRKKKLFYLTLTKIIYLNLYLYKLYTLYMKIVL